MVGVLEPLVSFATLLVLWIYRTLRVPSISLPASDCVSPSAFSTQSMENAKTQEIVKNQPLCILEPPFLVLVVGFL